MRAVISAQGMNPATFLKSAGITALAKKMEQIDRDTERQKYLDELQRGEQRCYDLVRAYVNAVRGVEVLPPAKVELEFREPVLPADPLHDAQALQLQQTLGLIGKVRARAKMDGIGVEEALRRMLADEELDARLMPEAEQAVAETVAVEVSDTETEAVAAEASTVQDTAMNGAQVASLMDIVAQVSARTMPAEAARLLIETAFPAVNPAVAAQIVASAAAFTPPLPVEPAPSEVPSGGV
jgi:urease gamma subunit